MKIFYAMIFAFLLFFPRPGMSKELTLWKNVEVKKLKRDRGHEVCIEKIPHVKQRKNYCAPASCSMVLRYLDQRYNQKDLGKLFKSDRKKGTYVSEIYEAFQLPEFQAFALVPIYTLTNNELSAMQAFYSQAAVNGQENPGKSKRSKKKKSRRRASGDGAKDWWGTLDPDLARKVLPRCRTQLKERFVELCRQYIDAGIPVMWSVSMALDPHTPSPEGHMRVINGYVVKNGSVSHILYRDSWRGHAGGSEMTLDNAVAMTKVLFAIVPREVQNSDLTRIKPLIKK
ncbi:MAG: C39 family peptidase [Lentisphaeria bacterium]|nr:C39 family peptidase [Lentisphaeria bacterium]MBR7144253.1 C39 family peptidase [Lentisphaeria bacterium]